MSEGSTEWENAVMNAVCSLRCSFQTESVVISVHSLWVVVQFRRVKNMYCLF